METDLSLQYHSIRIIYGTGYFYDTWNDYHLIPTDRPTVAVPKANIKMITVPGRRNPIDLTTYLTGHPTYTNRTGSWSFYTDPEYIDKHFGGWVRFEKLLRMAINGFTTKVILRDDPAYFYVGELTMGQLKPGPDRSTVTISYNFYPFKKSVIGSMDNWTFDDFDFRDGVIQYLVDLEVNTSRIVRVYGAPERISPHMSANANILVEKKNELGTWVSYGYVPTASIYNKNSVVPRLIIEDGINELRFIGNGSVTIDYRRGLL